MRSINGVISILVESIIGPKHFIRNETIQYLFETKYFEFVIDIAIYNNYIHNKTESSLYFGII